ncbi:MAG TPA: hypothetical protein VFG46_11075 [Chryseolinea sp.]|nr:hypothetical protein [Chryseolinea sp.]
MTDELLLDPFTLALELFKDRPDVLEIENIEDAESKLLEIRMTTKTVCSYKEFINGEWETGCHIAPPLEDTADMLEPVMQAEQMKIEQSKNS